MKKLDRKRPYAIVSGIGEKHMFEQDSKKFDGMGKEIKPENSKPSEENNKGAN